MPFLHLFAQVFFVAFSMFWEVLWPLLLGFILSAIVQALVSHATLSKVLGGESPRHLTLAALFGIASSSCSYAAIALARSLFQKGASFTASMVFELASTNLVLELGIILFVLLGWQFMAAEYLGGILMVICIALIFRFTLTPRLVALAHSHAAQGTLGKMEGHAAMDMSVSGEGTFLKKLFSRKGLQAVSEYFVMDIAAVWIDVVVGFLIAGIIAVLVPQTFWQVFFLQGNPSLAAIEGPLIGPLIAIVSFVCSVGNIPLAAVLWSSGMSFGGVVSFIFADLLVLPILDIYRKYYGVKVMFYIAVTFYITMALAGYLVEVLFSLIGIIPTNKSVAQILHGVSFNYTSLLDILALFLAGFLLFIFVRSGGLSMLHMMDTPEHEMHHC